MTLLELKKELERLKLDNKPTLSINQVLHLINNMDVADSKVTTKLTPKFIKKGDVCYIMGANYKTRPAVVIKTGDDVSFVIPMTSEDGDFAYIKNDNHRLLKEGWFSNHIILCKNDMLQQGFICEFGNMKVLNSVIKQVKESISKLQFVKKDQ